MAALSTRRIANGIGWLYLIYIAIIPSVATLFLLDRVDLTDLQAWPIFIFGIGLVGIHSAATGSYSALSTKIWRNLLLLLDAPILVGITVFMGHALSDAFIQLAFIELIPLIVALNAVVLISPIPTAKQRLISMIAVVPLLLIFGWIFLWYVSMYSEQVNPWFLYGAMIQGVLTQAYFLARDHVERDSAALVGVGVTLWMASFILGMMLL